MYTKWTQHLQTQEEKEDFEKTVFGSRLALDRLKVILTEELNALDRSEMDIKSFDQPNWDYKQAYKNGSRATFALVLKLIDLDQQERK